ncbi:cyclic-di-AMP receptor [Geomicrobium sediminis]|uniref:Uncharacterized protein YaaQ n=1 Tax=Geomicrobium sediminis TaxID=1347788 RepID=A0ABS2PHB3_9BACL|nr:uncharacterized protein YaaQ [Geomicrobium sediminis]
MKLLVCIVNDVYRDHLEKVLQNSGYRITELASSGGFRRKGNTTFLIGFKDQDYNDLKKTMEEACVHVEQKKKIQPTSKYRFTSFVMETATNDDWTTRFNKA